MAQDGTRCQQSDVLEHWEYVTSISFIATQMLQMPVFTRLGDEGQGERKFSGNLAFKLLYKVLQHD